MSVDNSQTLNSTKKFLRTIFLPIIAFVGAILILLYRFLFSWWLEKKSYSEKLRERFVSEIQGRVECLFTDYHAKVIPNTEEYPQMFDYVVVTLAVDTMLLRFIRGRMDFRVDVTPVDKPGGWREISSVVKNSDYTEDSNRKVDYYGLNDFGRFFQSNFDVLRHEVSKSDWRGSSGWLIPVG